MTGSTRPYCSEGLTLSDRKRSHIAKAVAAALPLLLAGLHPSIADEVKPLRLCADPDNLPFSSDRPDVPGLYNEIGAAVAEQLKRPVAAVWYRTYFAKRALRSTLLAGQCDLAIGFPLDPDFMGPALIFSKPILRASYALVAKKPAVPASLNQLNGQAIAVQYSTTPQNILANYSGIRMVTRLNPEDGLKALADGEAGAAFIWGPTAGYLNKTTYADAFNVVPVTGEGLEWPVSIAFAKKNAALRDEVNTALDRIGDKIDELMAKYGVSTDPPIRLAETSPAQTPAEDPAPAPPAQAGSPPAHAAVPSPTASVTSAALTQPSFSTAQPAPAPAGDGASLVAEGKELFNGTCAHCHGPNAEQSERKIDLRLLHHRYGDGMEDVFHTTVRAGRPAKGMPSWKDVFTDDQFTAILAYLKSKQSE